MRTVKIKSGEGTKGNPAMISATTSFMTTMIFNNKQIHKVKDKFCLIHKDLHSKYYLASEAVHLEFACNGWTWCLKEVTVLYDYEHRIFSTVLPSICCTCVQLNEFQALEASSWFPLWAVVPLWALFTILAGLFYDCFLVLRHIPFMSGCFFIIKGCWIVKTVLLTIILLFVFSSV